MVRATADLSNTTRVELKSLPEGFVVLRKMTYGAKMDRASKAARMSMKMAAGKRGNEADDMVIEMMQKQTTLMDFQQCILDHNLEDENGQKLNFSRSNDVERLDPRVGEEISIEIEKLNNLEVEDLGNSETASD